MGTFAFYVNSKIYETVRPTPLTAGGSAQALSNHPLSSHAPKPLPSHAQATNRARTYQAVITCINFRPVVQEFANTWVFVALRPLDPNTRRPA